MFVASALAQRFPVPLDDVESSGVSLMFVFVVASIVLFGTPAGLLIVFAATMIVGLTEHRPVVRSRQGRQERSSRSSPEPTRAGSSSASLSAPRSSTRST